MDETVSVMSEHIKAEIIADSVNPHGDRLTTFVLDYPRFVHAEVMTHRVFSKNAASSRAIPIEKMIEQVMDNPAMPVWWGKNQSGMQSKEELDNTSAVHEPFDILDSSGDCDFRGKSVYKNLTTKEKAQEIWLQARNKAIEYVRELNKLGLHKQIANRILEPWFNIRIVLSGTEFQNFFALRAHPDAQPEFQNLTYKMLEQYNHSNPKQLKTGEWHIPFGDQFDEQKLSQMIVKPAMMSESDGERWNKEHLELVKKIAIARCARVSYLNYEGKDDYYADVKLCERLFGNSPKHLSPTEHVAEAQDNSDFIGNFKGFKQYRKFFHDENLTDHRILKK
jgi:thymidylate synthase ThyX